MEPKKEITFVQKEKVNRGRRPSRRLKQQALPIKSKEDMAIKEYQNMNDLLSLLTTTSENITRSGKQLTKKSLGASSTVQGKNAACSTEFLHRVSQAPSHIKFVDKCQQLRNLVKEGRSKTRAESRKPIIKKTMVKMFPNFKPLIKTGNKETTDDILKEIK